MGKWIAYPTPPIPARAIRRDFFNLLSMLSKILLRPTKCWSRMNCTKKSGFGLSFLVARSNFSSLCQYDAQVLPWSAIFYTRLYLFECRSNCLSKQSWWGLFTRNRFQLSHPSAELSYNAFKPRVVVGIELGHIHMITMDAYWSVARYSGWVLRNNLPAINTVMQVGHKRWVEILIQRQAKVVVRRNKLYL